MFPETVRLHFVILYDVSFLNFSYIKTADGNNKHYKSEGKKCH